MIHTIVGKPRNGKTLYAFIRMVNKHLIASDSYIITNLVIDIDALQDYLIRRGINCNVRDRLRMISDDEMRDFWLIRKYPVLIKPEDYDSSKSTHNIDYSPVFNDSRFHSSAPSSATGKVSLAGTVYIIDEAHTVWSARGCMSRNSRHSDFYFSQHGKLNDTVYLITQNTKLIDVNLVRFSQDFSYCINHRLRKHGIFRGRNRIEVKTYPNPVSSSSEVTLEQDEFEIPIDLANCYDTSAGVGFPGGSTADNSARVAGISLRWIWVACVVVVLVGFCIFKFGSSALVDSVMHRPLANRSAPTQSPSSPRPAAPGSFQPDQIAVASGMWLLDGRPYVRLADGSLHSEDIDSINILKGIAIINGRPVRLQPSKVAVLSTIQPSSVVDN